MTKPQKFSSKYYKTPTEEDYPRFPLPCVVRNYKESWKSAFLREVSSKDKIYLVTDSPEPISTENPAASYTFCRIRKEPPQEPKADDDLYRNVDFSDIGKTVEVRDFTCQDWILATITKIARNQSSQYYAGGTWWQYARIRKEEPANPPSPPQEKPLQSHVAARFDCIDPVVLKLLAECLGYGAEKYYPYSYLCIPVEDHINHALNHINEHRRLGQDKTQKSEDELHLVNALARITFAISCLAQQGSYPDTYSHPEDKQNGV